MTFDLARSADCPICWLTFMEWGLVGHLNDRHGCDFFKIASLMPVSEEHG